MINLERLGDGSLSDQNFQTLGRVVNPPVPQARAFNNANISAGASTVVALTFNSEHFNNGGVHSTSVNSGRLTAPITGFYLIGGHVSYAANATGFRVTTIRLNGTTDIAADERGNNGGSEPVNVSLSSAYQLTAGQYVELTVLQNSGGALNILASSAISPEFWMVRLGGFVNVGV